MESYFLTDTGRVREHNEDSVTIIKNLNEEYLLAVADGMGGANKGEYASPTLVNSVVKDFTEMEKELTNTKQIAKWLNASINKANDKIFEKASKNEEYKGMGTTLSLCFIAKEMLVTAQVGDSRIYIIKDNKLTQISVDQTYATYLVNTNQITKEEAAIHKNRHMLTNAVGTKRPLNVDINSFEYNKEKILLCSDGLYNNVSSSVIESILKGNDTLDRKCFQLIAFGNANGGSDNMAVVIWESK